MLCLVLLGAVVEEPCPSPLSTNPSENLKRFYMWSGNTSRVRGCLRCDSEGRCSRHFAVLRSFGGGHQEAGRSVAGSSRCSRLSTSTLRTVISGATTLLGCSKL